MRKSLSFLVALLLSFVSLHAVQVPAQAVTPDETGDIYYWGAWDNATQSFRGLHRYNLDTKTDEALFANSPSCQSLVGQPAALAVDPAHNRIYWSITDGNPGVFALDLAKATCYVISYDAPVAALEIIPDSQTLVWTSSNGGLTLGTLDVSDLANLPAPNYSQFDIPGNTIFAVSDLVLAENKLFYMVFGDLGAGAMGQIYSTELNSIGTNFTLEKNTGLTPAPGQLAVTPEAFYYNIISAQIVKVPRDGSALTGYLDLIETAGFAIANGKLYSAKTRDSDLKSIPLTSTDQAMTSLPGGAIPDFNGKLRYSAATQGGLSTPTISAANSNSNSGTAQIPFSGVALSGNQALQYTVKSMNSSSTQTGFCVVTGSNCEISGLIDNKRYTVQLKMVYVFDNGGTQVVTVGSTPSNLANINVAASTYDPTTCTAAIADDPSVNPQSGSTPIVYAVDGTDIGNYQETFGPSGPAGGQNADDGYTQPIELPFSLTTGSGRSTIQISTNGVVNDNQSQTTINVLNADLDGKEGYISAGLCSLNLNGSTKQAFFITWNNFKFYDNASSSVTMQLILIKTTTWGYTAIRNYDQVEVSDPSNLTFSYMCPFVINPAWCNRVVADLPNTDVPIDDTIGTALISGGATDLTAHRSLATSQLGRYITQVASDPTLCDSTASKTLTVSYSAAGVQAVDPAFKNVVTENFDSYPVGPLQSPTTSPVGDFTGTLTTFPANQFGGAGGTGNGASVTDATYTAPANTCYKYLGFWWSAGSPNNAIQLLSENDVVLAHFTAAELYKNLTPEGANTPCPDVTNAYCGNPSNPLIDDPSEPFAYINLRFPAGFKKIRLYVTDNSMGFELDNISLSTVLPGGSETEKFLSGEEGVINPTTPTPSAKKAVKVFTGFEFEKSTLTTSTKRAIKTWLKGKTGFTKVTCVGYTGFNWNKRSTAYLTKLALQRATNVCNYIHTLNPSIKVKSKTAKLEKSKKDATRRVAATITN